MKYPAIAAAFYNTPHAITPEKLAEVRAFLDGKINPAAQDRFDDAQENAPVRAGPRDGYQMVGRVAVVNVFGVIAQRMNLMTAMSGGTSTEQLGSTIDALTADRTVRAIVLNIDSPGGSVFGVPELGDKILKARDEKKVVAQANSVAASAAFWIATQAGELVVTPSGQVGSVGVVAVHTDESKADELAGVKNTLVTAGRYKAELDPSQPLSAEAKDAVQAAVDQYYSMFVKAVAKGRGVSTAKVDADYGQGRMVLAKDAVERGMADRVATLEQTLTRLGAGDGGRSPAAGVRERAAQVAALGLPTR